VVTHPTVLISQQSSQKIKALNSGENIMLDNSNKELFKSETNEDHLNDDDSAYTTTDKSTEPIHPGDVVLYYCPIFVTDDPRGLQETTILAVNPNDNYPLVLSKDNGIPNTTHVKGIKVFCNNMLMEHSGTFREIRRYVLKKPVLLQQLMVYIWMEER
jgi:hypothetical protein